MSVIVEFQLPAAEFDLGRILRVEGGSTIELETLVPLGEATVPLFWIHDATRESYVEFVDDHASVDDAAVVDTFEDRTLFTLDWDANQDDLFQAVERNGGQLLSATGTASSWNFEVRFPSRAALSGFSTECADGAIALDVDRIYSPTETAMDSLGGLTSPQYDAITLAMRRGYYEIPRSCTTKELGEELGISDQAVMERLRRAITTIVTNAVGPFDEPERRADDPPASELSR